LHLISFLRVCAVLVSETSAGGEDWKIAAGWRRYKKAFILRKTRMKAKSHFDCAENSSTRWPHPSL
jgi:hypothetical protein